MREAVICEPLRSPVGGFGGVFRDVAVTELAAERDRRAARAHLAAPGGRGGRRAGPGLPQRRGARARPRRRARRRPADRGRGTAGRPPLRRGAAGGGARLHGGADRRLRSRAGRRGGEHEPGGVLRDGHPLGHPRWRRCARGSPRPRARDGRRSRASGPRRDDRNGRGAAPRVRDPARRAGRVRVAFPPAGRRRAAGWDVRRGDRADHGQRAPRAARGRPRRAPARRHVARAPRRAAADHGLERPRGDGHGGQRQRAERRRRGVHRHAPRPCRRARPAAVRAARVVGRRRRRAGDDGNRAGPGHAARARARAA